MPTIGIALSVPAPWGPELQAYRLGLGDALGAEIPTHVTLVPPVEVAEDLLPAVEQHVLATGADHAPWLVRLSGTGSFRPVTEVVYLALADGAAECAALAADLRGGPVQLDPAYPFHPHVTLAHDVAPELLDRAEADFAEFEFSFRVSEFHLYLHENGTGWRSLSRVPLTGSGRSDGIGD